jgi:predicted ester cyclase
MGTVNFIGVKFGNFALLRRLAMSTESNKAVYQRWINEVWHKGNLAVHDELVSPDCMDHNPVPGLPPGSAGMVALAAMMHDGHSDLKWWIDQLVGEGDVVVGRWEMSGVHTGPVFGVSGTGREVHMSGMDMVRVVGGRIVEIWHNEDVIGHLVQIGVVSLPGTQP